MGYKGPVYKAQVHRDLKASNPMLISQSISEVCVGRTVVKHTLIT